MLTVFEFKLEVASPCQNDCEFCAHADLMRHVKGFQLSMEQVDRFLYYTERSNYFIRSLSLHGPGEPFLWKNLNEGIIRLKRSRAIGWMTIVTNGLLLDRIDDEAMQSLDKLFVSVYANYNKHEELQRFRERYGNKVGLWDGSYFWQHSSSPGETAPATGGCNCFGPMLYNDYVFPYCGPPVFGAAKAKKIDPIQDKTLCVPLGIGYLESYNAALSGRMDICRYCWANPNFKGAWQKNDTRKILPNTPPDSIRRAIPSAGANRPQTSPSIR